jgi:colicin import membrane protein
MRNAVVGSGLVHLALLVVLLIARGPAAMIVPGPDVVQVALLDPTSMTIAPPPPEPAPKPEPATIQPVEEEGIKLEPKKPAPKKSPETKKPEERPPVTRAQALPSAPAGTAGLKGDVSLDAASFEFTYYLVLIRNKIASNWAPPAGLTTSGQPVRAVVYFRVSRDGRLSAPRLETGSGAEFFDLSAVRAVQLSDPLPPLPLGFSGSELGVHFGFEWESP